MTYLTTLSITVANKVLLLIKIKIIIKKKRWVKYGNWIKQAKLTRISPLKSFRVWCANRGVGKKLFLFM